MSNLNNLDDSAVARLLQFRQEFDRESLYDREDAVVLDDEDDTRNAEVSVSSSDNRTFNDEVDVYQQHWWRCNGPCQRRAPYFGYVKRSINLAPSAKDFWWPEHQATCGGVYTKIREPEGYGQSDSGINKGKEGTGNAVEPSKDIQSFCGKRHTLFSNIEANNKASGSSLSEEKLKTSFMNTATFISGVGPSTTITSQALVSGTLSRLSYDHRNIFAVTNSPSNRSVPGKREASPIWSFKQLADKNNKDKYSTSALNAGNSEAKPYRGSNSTFFHYEAKAYVTSNNTSFNYKAKTYETSNSTSFKYDTKTYVTSSSTFSNIHKKMSSHSSSRPIERKAFYDINNASSKTRVGYSNYTNEFHKRFANSFSSIKSQKNSARVNGKSDGFSFRAGTRPGIKDLDSRASVSEIGAIKFTGQGYKPGTGEGGSSFLSKIRHLWQQKSYSVASTSSRQPPHSTVYRLSHIDHVTTSSSISNKRSFSFRAGTRPGNKDLDSRAAVSEIGAIKFTGQGYKPGTGEGGSLFLSKIRHLWQQKSYSAASTSSRQPSHSTVFRLSHIDHVTTSSSISNTRSFSFRAGTRPWIKDLDSRASVSEIGAIKFTGEGYKPGTRENGSSFLSNRTFWQQKSDSAVTTSSKQPSQSSFSSKKRTWVEAFSTQESDNLDNNKLVKIDKEVSSYNHRGRP